MLLLAIDTSTSAITVALHGDEIAATATVLDARGHTEHLAPLIERCLESAGRSPADVTDVVVGQMTGPTNGPGGPRTDPEYMAGKPAATGANAAKPPAPKPGAKPAPAGTTAAPAAE